MNALARAVSLPEAASPARRVIAKIIDLLMAGLTLSFFKLWLSPTVAILCMYAWLIACDGWGSWGKWIVGIKCVHAETGADCTVLQSLQRNLLFLPSMGRAFLLTGPKDQPMPSMRTAAMVLALIGLVIIALELRWMSQRPDRRRLGDAMGNTVVVMGRAPFWS